MASSSNAFRQYQSGVINSQATTVSGEHFVPLATASDSGSLSLKDATQKLQQQGYLPVVQNAPGGMEVCANAVLKFAEFYTRFAGVKIGTLIGLKESLVSRSIPLEEVNRALNSKLQYFPRSYKSYSIQIIRLAKLGRQYPEAMIFALIALLPRSTGLGKQLTGYNADLSTTAWMQQLHSSVSFGSLASQVKARIPPNCDSFLELLGYLVELAVADAMHAFVGREEVNLSSQVSEWVTKLCSYMMCKHPAWCLPGSWKSVQKYPFSKLSNKIYSAVPNKKASRAFRPVEVPFSLTRSLNFEQWASVLGLLSISNLDAVTKHMLDLAQKTTHDPMSVVLLAGCRYIRWRVNDELNARPNAGSSVKKLFDLSVTSVRTFLRFIIGQLDGHRDIPERVLHISTIDSVVLSLGFTNVYAKQEILSIFQVEIYQIYTMCVRWSKQEGLKDAAYLLLANIFARCPSSFVMKSHNFIAKRLIGPFTSTEKSRRCIEAHIQILRGCHVPAVTGWLPEASQHFKHWSSQYLRWETDEFSVFQHVPRADETRETRIGRVMQICEAIYFKSQLNGGLKLELELVNCVVALLLQCSACAFEYMTTIVLPAMLGMGTMHRKENDKKEWMLAALITLRIIMDHSSGFVHNASKSIATAQDEEVNHITFTEFLQDVVTNFKPMLKELTKEQKAKIKSGDLEIHPHIAVVGPSGLDILDDNIDIGPDIVAASASIPICRDFVDQTEGYLSDYIDNSVFKENEVESSIRKMSESFRLANRLRLRAVGSQGKGTLHDLYGVTTETDKKTTHSRLVAELNFMLTYLEPNYLCGLEDGTDFFHSLFFVQDSILLESASASVKAIVESLPSRIPDLLGLICRKASVTVFSSTHKILYSLGHAGFLVESWIYHLGAKSSLPSVMLSESQQPLEMIEAWALASLCHGHESVRTYAVWLLRMTGRLSKLLESLKSENQTESNATSSKPFVSCSTTLMGDGLIDRAFYRASTDYAELDGIQLPSLKADAGSIFQPTIIGLMTSKHSGKCWPNLSRNLKGQEVELTKSELHLNLILEIADVICGKKKYQATLSQLWSILKSSIKNMPNITNTIKAETSGNTLVTTLCFFFAIASTAREAESSEYGFQHALHYGERKQMKIARPSYWSAAIEGDASTEQLRNVGTAPMQEDHISESLEKWSYYCSGTDMKNAASALKFGTLVDKDINFEQVRKWIENKRSRKYDKAQETSFATDVRKTILSFVTSKSYFSNLLKNDYNMREIVYKTVKSAHWSSMVVLVQCLISWYEETSATSKTNVFLELISYLLTSHNIHLSMQYSDNMLDCVLTAVSALEHDLETLIIGSDSIEEETSVGPEKIDSILQYHKLIEEHSSLLCFLSSSFKKLYGRQDNLWPARRRNHSLMFLSRISATIVQILTLEASGSQMEDKQQRIESLVNPVALALNELVSVSSVDDIKNQMKFPKTFDKVNHHLSITLKLLLESKEDGFQLDSFIRSCMGIKDSTQLFNALYHYILVSSSRLNGPIEFEDIDNHCVRNVIQHAPILILACTSEIFKENHFTFGNATKFLIVIAAVLHVTYTDNHDNLEFQATMAMLHGLHHSLSSTKDTYSIDVVKRVAGICTKMSVEVIAEACLLLKEGIERNQDILWILKTLSHWCEPIDTIMLNQAKVNVLGDSRERKEFHSNRVTSSIILSELCSLTVKIHSKGGISKSIYLAGMIEVWESLCYSHGEFNNSSMIEITTFLMQKAIDGDVSRVLLRRILDTICKNLQEQMISVLSTLIFRSLDLTLTKDSKSINQNMLSLSGLSATSLSNIFQGMTSFPQHLQYAKLFISCLLTLDNSNSFLRSGMRSLLSSLMSQIKSARDREPLGDVLLRLCNAANDTSYGKILEWSGITAEEYPDKNLKATIRACTVYLSGISPNFDIELAESALDIAFTAKDMTMSGRAFELIACLDCYGKMNLSDVGKSMTLMARILEGNGSHLLGLNKESSSLLQTQENLSSQALYVSRQVCRFLHGLIEHSNDGNSEKSDLVAYFWMTLAMMRCKIRPVYSYCLDLLSSILSNKGDAFLSSFAKVQRNGFWDFCDDWIPQMDGLGPLLLWGSMQDNYPLFIKSTQLLLHASALKEEEIFHRAQTMQSGDLTGTKVFKTVVAIVWLHFVLEENSIPKHVSINHHLDYRTFVQLEFFKAKSMVALGQGITREWESFIDVLVLGARGNFSKEPHRFLTACVRNISSNFGKRDLLEFGEVLTILACKGSRHLRLPVLKMVLLLISQPEKYFASELLEKFFPILDHDLGGDYECKDLLERISQLIMQSNAYKILKRGGHAINFDFYDNILSEEGNQRIKSALSAITQVTAKLDNYVIGKDTNESSWESLLETKPLLTISEKLARTSMKRGPKHRKKKLDDEALIESDFLNSFMNQVKPQAVQSTFLSSEQENKPQASKGLGDFYLGSANGEAKTKAGAGWSGKVGSKVRRKKKAGAQKPKYTVVPPSPPPLSVLRATMTPATVTRNLFSKSDSDSYYSEDDVEEGYSDYSTDEYSDEYSYSYSYSPSDSYSASDGGDDSESYDYSSSYSTSTSQLSYSSAD